MLIYSYTRIPHLYLIKQELTVVITMKTLQIAEDS